MLSDLDTVQNIVDSKEPTLYGGQDSELVISTPETGLSTQSNNLSTSLDFLQKYHDFQCPPMLVMCNSLSCGGKHISSVSAIFLSGVCK